MDTISISPIMIHSGFAPFCNDSDQRCANLYRASQGARCSAVKLGVLQLYLCQQSLLSDLLNQRKSTPKHFLEGVRLSQLFQLFCHKQTNCYLIVHPNQSIKLSELQVISLCIPVLFLPRVETPGETHFSPPMFMKESFLNKNVCLRATNKRRSDHGSCTSVFRQYSQFSCIIFELGGSDGFS